MRLFKCSAVMLAVMMLCLQMRAWAYIPSQPNWPERSWHTYTSEQDINQDLIASFLESHNINSLDAYVTWFKSNMKYRTDEQGDSWAQPLQTLVRGGGDCEDLAFLNVAALKHFGIEARVLGTKKDSNHHVFTVFKYHSKIMVFDNTNLIRTRVSSLDQIALFLHKKYNVDYVLEVDLNPRRIRVLFNRATLNLLNQSINQAPTT